MTEKAKKGFAAISPERRQAIASLGGKAAHAKGTAHRFTKEEARVAGKKGAAAVVHRHKFTSEEAKIAGKKGGAATAERIRRMRKLRPPRIGRKVTA